MLAHYMNANVFATQVVFQLETLLAATGSNKSCPSQVRVSVMSFLEIWLKIQSSFYFSCQATRKNVALSFL